MSLDRRIRESASNRCQCCRSSSDSLGEKSGWIPSVDSIHPCFVSATVHSSSASTLNWFDDSPCCSSSRAKCRYDYSESNPPGSPRSPYSQWQIEALPQLLAPDQQSSKTLRRTSVKWQTMDVLKRQMRLGYRVVEHCCQPGLCVRKQGKKYTWNSVPQKA